MDIFKLLPCVMKNYRCITNSALFVSITVLIIGGCGESNNNKSPDSSVANNLHSETGPSFSPITTDSTGNDDIGDKDDAELSDGLSSASVLGDWFPCMNDDCTRLYFNGMRLLPGNRYTELFASKPEHKAENYCYISNDALIGTYQFDGITLKLSHPMNGNLDLTMIISGDQAKVIHKNRQTPGLKRVKSSFAKGPCKERIPWICMSPIVENGVDPDKRYSCSWDWVCDRGRYKASCWITKEDVVEFECECSNEGSLLKSFSINMNVCNKFGFARSKSVFAWVNKHCGWSIWSRDLFNINIPH